jgi:hypothetical protein
VSFAAPVASISIFSGIFQQEEDSISSFFLFSRPCQQRRHEISWNVIAVSFAWRFLNANQLSRSREVAPNNYQTRFKPMQL